MGSTRTQVYLFKRYLWLYDKIASYGPISFEQLSEMWQHSSLGEGCPLPHKTFENHRRAVENLFDIDILCNRSDNTYYISQPDSPDSSQGCVHFSTVRLPFRMQWPEVTISPDISNLNPS